MLRKRGFSSLRRSIRPICRVKVEASQSRTSDGTDSDWMSLSSSSVSTKRLKGEEGKGRVKFSWRQSDKGIKAKSSRCPSNFITSYVTLLLKMPWCPVQIQLCDSIGSIVFRLTCTVKASESSAICDGKATQQHIASQVLSAVLRSYGFIIRHPGSGGRAIAGPNLLGSTWRRGLHNFIILDISHTLDQQASTLFLSLRLASYWGGNRFPRNK